MNYALCILQIVRKFFQWTTARHGCCFWQNSLHQQKSELEKSIEKHEAEVTEQRTELLRIQDELNRQKVRSLIFDR